LRISSLRISQQASPDAEEQAGGEKGAEGIEVVRGGHSAAEGDEGAAEEDVHPQEEWVLDDSLIEPRVEQSDDSVVACGEGEHPPERPALQMQPREHGEERGDQAEPAVYEDVNEQMPAMPHLRRHRPDSPRAMREEPLQPVRKSGILHEGPQGTQHILSPCRCFIPILAEWDSLVQSRLPRSPNRGTHPPPL